MPWLDAAWHPAGPAMVPLPFDPSDRGLLLGDGVFDTAMVLGGQMVWRAAHLARLVRHAAAIGIAVDVVRLEAAADGALAELAGGHGVLRLTVTRGAGPRGLAPPPNSIPTVLGTASPFSAKILFAPLALQKTAIRRNATSPLSRVKSLCYGDAVLACESAARDGCGDALFLNDAGRVACTGAGTLFVMHGRTLATPPVSEGVLDGIVRSVLLDAAAEAGLDSVERPVAVDELADADAVLCTNSLRLVAAVTAIDGRSLSRDSRILELAGLVAAHVRADVGLDPSDATAS